MDDAKIKLMTLVNQGLKRYYKAHAKYISGKGGLTLPTEAGCIADVLIENGITVPINSEEVNTDE